MSRPTRDPALSRISPKRKLLIVGALAAALLSWQIITFATRNGPDDALLHTIKCVIEHDWRQLAQHQRSEVDALHGERTAEQFSRALLRDYIAPSAKVRLEPILEVLNEPPSGAPGGLKRTVREHAQNNQAFWVFVERTDKPGAAASFAITASRGSHGDWAVPARQVLHGLAHAYSESASERSARITAALREAELAEFRLDNGATFKSEE